MEGILRAEGDGPHRLGPNVGLYIDGEDGQPGPPLPRLYLRIHEHPPHVAARFGLPPDAYRAVNLPLQAELIGHPEIRLVGTNTRQLQSISEPLFCLLG